MLRCRWILLLAALACTPVQSARAQITSLADDILLISKGLQAQEQARADTHLGEVIAGQGRSPFGPSPGASGSRIQGLLGPTGSAVAAVNGNQSVLSAITSEGQHTPGAERLPHLPAHAVAAAPLPVYGQLEVPESLDDGPPNGITLDMAIDTLVQNNIDLRTKAFEIPKSRADVLTASLRSNPMVFATASSVPYGSYSVQRPGDNSYSATVIYPFDVSHKRWARTEVASRAHGVLEAQYQDAVRQEIDNLYNVYVDLVAARETVRYAMASQNSLSALARIMEGQFRNSQVSQADLERVLIQRDMAELGVEQAQQTLAQARRNLALMLNVPIEAAESLDPRGTLVDRAPAPARDELRAIALGTRPDLMAYRLGVERAQSDVKLAEAEKYTDVFLLYSPWEFRNNAPVGGQNATSWSVAAFGTVPLFNRNQGNIRRAQVNVAQTQTELVGLEHQVVAEVERAYAEYAVSRAAVDKIERGLLTRSRRVRDITATMLKNSQVSTIDYLNAQKDHNDVVRQYRDVLIRHRRSMLRLNTVIAKRVLP